MEYNTMRKRDYNVCYKVNDWASTKLMTGKINLMVSLQYTLYIKNCITN